MDWKEYLFWVQKNDAKNYDNCLLDTLVWIDLLGQNKHAVEFEVSLLAQHDESAFVVCDDSVVIVLFGKNCLEAQTPPLLHRFPVFVLEPHGTPPTGETQTRLDS